MGELRALLSRHLPRVRALAARLVGDGDDTEDVVQETLVELWRRADEFDHRRGCEIAWVTVIARSRALDLLRRREARLRALPEPVAAEPPPPRCDLGQLRSAVSRLPCGQQIAIELAYLEGLTHVEIAARLGVPLGTIKTRIRAGLRRLAIELDDGEAANGGDEELSGEVGAAAMQQR